jgi:hypothetical protein
MVSFLSTFISSLILYWLGPAFVFFVGYCHGETEPKLGGISVVPMIWQFDYLYNTYYLHDEQLGVKQTVQNVYWTESKHIFVGGGLAGGRYESWLFSLHFCYDDIFHLLNILTGLHVDERCSVSVKDFYCWISIISSEGDSLQFDLRPVEVVRGDYQLLTYHMWPTGEVLSRISTELLLLGDYGAFAPGMNCVLCIKEWSSHRVYIFFQTARCNDTTVAT